MAVVFWRLLSPCPQCWSQGVIFHQISYFEEQGLDAQNAANIFPILAASMVISGKRSLHFSCFLSGFFGPGKGVEFKS